MKNEVSLIKNLVQQNKLDLAIQSLIDYETKRGLNNIVSYYYWSQKDLQKLIEERSKDEYMHWMSTYDLIAGIETLKASWFYRDDSGCFYNIDEVLLISTVEKIEQTLKAA